jgi:hypothetical protein
MYSLIIIMLVMSPLSENSKSLTTGAPLGSTAYYVESFELIKVESLAECQALGEAYLQTPTHPMDTTKEYGFTCTKTPEKFI